MSCEHAPMARAPVCILCQAVLQAGLDARIAELEKALGEALSAWEMWSEERDRLYAVLERGRG